jgi:hypothetical protein
MSDPRQVPPSPGTSPRVSKHGQRPYREDASIYEGHREKGTHPYTDDEVEARIIANAADAAAVVGSGQLDVPFLRELVALFRHRLYRDLPLTPAARISLSKETMRAEAERTIADEQGQRWQRRRRELESARQRMPRPIGGTKFSHPAWLAACLVPAAAIEFLGSVAALEAAFKLSWVPATIFAVSISAILLIAADQFGIALASITRNSRRWAITVTALLITIAVGAGIWAIATLAESRAANTAYKAAGERSAESGGTGLHATTKPRPAAEALKAVEKASAERSSGSVEPDIGFFVPLSILILATSTLLAFRVEAASEWNGLDEELGDVIGEEDGARKLNEQARITRQEDRAPRGEAANELAAYVERQQALLVVWLERFQAEYQRFCALEEREPRELVVPAIPDSEGLLIELLTADGETQRSPGSPPPHSAGPRGRRRGPAAGPGTGSGSNPGSERQSDHEPESEAPPRPPRTRGRRRTSDGRPPGM